MRLRRDPSKASWPRSARRQIAASLRSAPRLPKPRALQPAPLMGKKKRSRRKRGKGKRTTANVAQPQGGAAVAQDDATFTLPPAMHHYMRAKDEPRVRALLTHVGAADLGRDRGVGGPFEGWPGTQPLVAALVRAGEDSDANLATLFGSAAHVRRELEEVRMYMTTAQPGSPADLMGLGPSALPVGRGHEPNAARAPERGEEQHLSGDGAGGSRHAMADEPEAKAGRPLHISKVRADECFFCAKTVPRGARKR